MESLHDPPLAFQVESNQIGPFGCEPPRADEPRLRTGHLVSPLIRLSGSSSFAFANIASLILIDRNQFGQQMLLVRVERKTRHARTRLRSSA